ncbi:unnamed protein product [Bursaphelenchus okinawaensis]|uniref:PBC domain-containing protein n=1 Tax=Bursaphelenchus okinawaensis TaxID=465554 RepID=A0A811KHC0_9BILA|nr:unnamed protein product [Bursaphelenchus okinawaensis]CAG9103191.1 unnamed protein product [Bursaphelenchus okinawaensis]
MQQSSKMNALVGEDRPLFEPPKPSEKTVPTLSSLLEELWNQSKDDNLAQVAKEVKSSKYFNALRSVLEDRKRELSFRFMSFEHAKLEEQSNSLKKSTQDCLDAIACIDKDSNNEAVQIVDDYLQKGNQDLQTHIHQLSQAVWTHECQLERVLQNHSKIRPISVADVENGKRNLKVKFLIYGNQVQNDFCNFALLSSTYFMRR